MKSLKPSMREKKRYLLVRGKKEGIYNAIRDFLGTSGMAKVSLSFIKIDPDKSIISVNREALDQVRAAICIWPEKMEVLRVSGSLKQLKKN
ncbi:Ribonuclease P protein component 2 [uncultured archaeon]|nr:Ribonuclease P protein component 2 [uncultured archaeon]